jgi:HPt (histidine-containing phosphotransfer) domain-containing protein
MRILKIYHGDAEERIPQIIDALGSGDISRYVTLVHAIKSASRSIGAADVGNAAEALEDAGKNNDIEALQKNTGAFLVQLGVLIKSISDALENTPQEKEGALSIEELNLEPLKEALSGFEVESVNKLLGEYTASSLNHAARAFISEIEQDVLLFEYEQAIEKIDGLSL